MKIGGATFKFEPRPSGVLIQSSTFPPTSKGLLVCPFPKAEAQRKIRGYGFQSGFWWDVPRQTKWGRLNIVWLETVRQWKTALPISFEEFGKIKQRSCVGPRRLANALEDMEYPKDLLRLSPCAARGAIELGWGRTHLLDPATGEKATIKMPRWAHDVPWPILPNRNSTDKIDALEVRKRVEQGKIAWMLYLKWVDQLGQLGYFGVEGTPKLSVESYRRYCHEVLQCKAYPKWNNIDGYYSYLLDGQRMKTGQLLPMGGAVDERYKQVMGVSPSKALAAARFNHRIQLDIARKGAAVRESDETPMPDFGFKLPREWEDRRLKTVGKMRRAGRECQHCVGGYANPNTRYVFFRQGDVVAQVQLDGTVTQCYDSQNRRTDRSEAFKQKIKEELSPDLYRQAKELGLTLINALGRAPLQNNFIQGY